MSVVATALRELTALGVSGEALFEAVERIERAALEERASTVREAVEIASRRADDELATRKAKAAERTRKWREARDAETSVTVTSPNITEHHGDASPLSRPLSPQTPLSPTHSPESVTTRTRGTEIFERFWAAYPRKDAKATARKRFTIAMTKTSPDVLFAAVERQRAWDQWQRGFVPHAATWLHQERWTDEEPPTADPRKAPHERTHANAKLDAKQANYARAWEGSERAFGRDREP